LAVLKKEEKQHKKGGEKERLEGENETKGKEQKKRRRSWSENVRMLRKRRQMTKRAKISERINAKRETGRGGKEY
jgi:hypothetical protein